MNFGKSNRISLLPAAVANRALTLIAAKLRPSGLRKLYNSLAAIKPPAPGLLIISMRGLPGMYLSKWRPVSRAAISLPPPGVDPTKNDIVLPSKKLFPAWACSEGTEITALRNAEANTTDKPSRFINLPFPAQRETNDRIPKSEI